MNQPTKKGHPMVKFVTIGIVILALLGFGIFLGLRFQGAYNRFLFNASQSMVSVSFYGALILAAILLVVILYLVFRSRRARK